MPENQDQLKELAHRIINAGRLGDNPFHINAGAKRVEFVDIRVYNDDTVPTTFDSLCRPMLDAD